MGLENFWVPEDIFSLNRKIKDTNDFKWFHFHEKAEKISEVNRHYDGGKIISSFSVLASCSFFSPLVISLSLIRVNRLNYTTLTHSQSWFSEQVLEVLLLILAEFSVIGFISFSIFSGLQRNRPSVTPFTESNFYFSSNALCELPLFGLVLCCFWGGLLAQIIYSFCSLIICFWFWVLLF